MSEDRSVLIRARYGYPSSSAGVIEDFLVYIKDGVIAECGKYDAARAKAIADADPDVFVLGGVGSDQSFKQMNAGVVPAFTNAHTHYHEPLVAGREKGALNYWLSNVVTPFGMFLDRIRKEYKEKQGVDPYAIIYGQSILESIHHGIGTSGIHHCGEHKNHVAELTDMLTLARVRATIYVGSHCGGGFPNSMLDTTEGAIARLDQALKYVNDKVKVAPGPEHIFSSDKQEMLRRLYQWAEEHNTVFHIHCAEQEENTMAFYNSQGISEVEFLDQAGALGKRTMLAHMVHPYSMKDLDLIAKREATLVLNPLANTDLASGMPPLREIQKRGINYVIATDGMGSGDNLSLLMAARAFQQYYCAAYQTQNHTPSSDLFGRITARPAQVMEVNSGELAVGKLGDVALISLDPKDVCEAASTCSDTFAEDIFRRFNGRGISTLIVDGNVIMENGEVETLNEDKIARHIRQLSEMFKEFLMEYQRIKDDVKIGA